MKQPGSSQPIKSMSALIKSLKKSRDFIYFTYTESEQPLYISYFRTLINQDMLHRDVLSYVLERNIESLRQLQSAFPIEQVEISDDIDVITKSILSGHVMIRMEENASSCVLVNICGRKERQISKPDIEYNVIGPQEAFVESIEVNLGLIRRRLPISTLTVKEVTIGELSHTCTAVVYIDGIANEDNVEYLLNKLKEVEIDNVTDSSYLIRMLEDNPNSLFPQSINTERPDRVAAVLAEGKIALFVDGTPYVMTLPTTLVEFFSTLEDYNLPWIMASCFRLLRAFAVLFSILATPLYVAILTYHYEIIPKELLETLIASRSKIPFPPVIEAIFLEGVIELLREAGARLPSKVALTVGIVGGIVIGQASVEASLTSNILIIIVALSALSSFTTPIYKMSNTIRLLRFPFMLAAQMMGLFGIMIFSLFVLTHLLRSKSLGRPYLAPFYPTRFSDWKDSIIRLDMSFLSKRPITAQAQIRERFDVEKVKQKKKKIKEMKKSDFDE
ncbi:spore germination protein [Bacillus sp. 165]|uniref:spore germination protein n=1 Tax=Bacillus sp. 165 TaxID=1529117 RepID=UPI001ADB032B|nr:spore germination protein [Bacillus sp. 165]MBO9130979.1 spore germination protein [Bacillus sp. 165]